MRTSTIMAYAALVVGAGIVGAGAWIYQRSFLPPADAHAEATSHEPLGVEPKFPVEIQGLPDTPTVLTDVLTHRGEPVEVACSTCHTTRTPNATKESRELDSFHQGLVMQHGGLSCLSCHNEDNYDSLKLADGSAIEYAQAMQLCAQCHGPQYRDYQNGSHGGMNGYWDRSRGPRTRNACTVCHDAHAPAYPQLMPVFPPRDIVPPNHPHQAEH